MPHFLGNNVSLRARIPLHIFCPLFLTCLLASIIFFSLLYPYFSCMIYVYIYMYIHTHALSSGGTTVATHANLLSSLPQVCKTRRHWNTFPTNHSTKSTKSRMRQHPAGHPDFGAGQTNWQSLDTNHIFTSDQTRLPGDTWQFKVSQM